MEILKSKIEALVKELPEKIDGDEIMYRIYLLQKIEAGEYDIKQGKVLSHDDAVSRISKKWQK
jgi:hypothetical protein